MNTPLRILHLEDNRRDAELIRSTLEEEGLECERVHVKNQQEFEAALTANQFDLILSDFAIPHYNGLAALDFAHRNAPSVPFILLSGTIGEELAVQSLKTGATDYILKQKSARLVPAIRRALEEAEERNKRQQADESLRKSEERFQFVARATNDVIWDWSLETNAVWRNEGFAQKFGYRAEEVEATVQWWIDRLHPDDKERILCGLEATGTTAGEAWAGEYRFRRGDGTYAHILDRGYVIHDDTGKVVRMIGAMMDVTLRRQAEEQVREQAALLDKAQDAIHVREVTGHIRYWNKSAERVYGWAATDVLGKSANELFSKVFPELLAAEQQVIEHGEWIGELNRVTKDGKPVVVESRWTLVRDSQEKPKSILIIDTDITEKKKLEAQFLRAQRMESIGALAGGIAHDLNNILTPILMVSELLQNQLTSKEDRQMLEIVKASAGRGSEMVKQILFFARGVSGSHTVLQLKHLANDMEKLLQGTFPRSIRIETDFGKDLHPIDGDATQLHQVLMNLCVNARDAMPNGGSLSITLANAQLIEKQTPTRPDPVSGPYVVLTVQDTGQGIPPHLIDKIYEPFFTTKGVGKGTGLGLSTVLGIVKTHHGFLEVSSVVNQGTIFRVYFPATAGTVVAATIEPAAPPMGRGEQILVVDDEFALREITREMLGMFNYQVLTAQDGVEATTLYHRHRDQIKVVITDMMMPNMDGTATIQALQQINPHVRIICVSGLGSKPNLPEAMCLNVHASLKKPYSSGKLLTILRGVIDDTTLTKN